MDNLDAVMEGAGLFVNTTSLGMKGGAVPDFDFSPLHENAIVAISSMCRSKPRS
ncbi:MAG: hypothetical protein QUV08_07120 [Parasphingorhabdus sp.]|nr:hypothetical protein [Parasphingorhabdus sp.]